MHLEEMAFRLSLNRFVENCLNRFFDSFLKKLLKTFLWKSCQGLPGEGRSVAKFDGWSSKQPRKKSLQQRPALRSHIGQAQVLVGFSYIDD